MGRHGKVKKLWPEILGLIAAACAIAAFLILIIGFPQFGP